MAAGLIAVLAATAGALAAQEPPDAGADPTARSVEAARRLGDRGAYAAAADTLRRYLRAYPEDAGSRWLLARYLYWTGRTEDAVDHYDRALQGLPHDPWLRHEYAEALAATGADAHALDVLAPLLAPAAPAAARARALGLAGTIAYRDGDYSRAIDRYRAALEIDPSLEEARAGLAGIRAATRPWLTVRGSLLDDDQPYRRYRGAIEGGVYVTPLWTVAAGGAPRLLDDSPSALGPGTGRGTASAWAEGSGWLPDVQTGLRVRGGGWWDQRGSTTWLGEVEVTVRLPARLSLRGSAGRTRYLATVASADTLLMVRSAEVAIGRAESPGWAGEAAARMERFPDGNTVRSAYLWALAPVLPALRLGYGVGWQDALESRWVPTTTTPTNPRQPTTSVTGVYEPYYTPQDVTVHSALAELAVGGDPLGLRVNGRYGVHAVELAPAVRQVEGLPGGGLTTIEFVERSFTPWAIRASLDWVGPLLTLRLAAERERTAFWEQNLLSVSATYRFRRPRLR